MIFLINTVIIISSDFEGTQLLGCFHFALFDVAADVRKRSIVDQVAESLHRAVYSGILVLIIQGSSFPRDLPLIRYLLNRIVLLDRFISFLNGLSIDFRAILAY